MKRLFAILLTGAFAQCASADPALVSCGADALQDAIGQLVETLALPEGRRVRVIRPGDAVTMDHFPERLNVLVDDEDRVTGFRCG